MKKNICDIICIILVIMICCTACGKNNAGNTATDEEMYELTQKEADRMNKNSNLLGCVLLDEAPEDAVTAQPNIIRTDSSDNYMYFPYREGHFITSIVLYSSDADIFGISIGANMEEVNEKMKAEDYEAAEEAPPNEKMFKKYNISISFEFGEDELVKRISVGVDDQDPNEPRKVY